MGRGGRAMKETKKKKPENSQISQHPRKKNISTLSKGELCSRDMQGRSWRVQQSPKRTFSRQESLYIQTLMGGPVDRERLKMRK